MGSHSVTCHPTEVRIPHLPQAKQVLDWANPKGCKTELTYATWKLTCWKLNPRATCQSQVQRPTAAPPRNTRRLSVYIIIRCMAKSSVIPPSIISFCSATKDQNASYKSRQNTILYSAHSYSRIHITHYIHIRIYTLSQQRCWEHYFKFK